MLEYLLSTTRKQGNPTKEIILRFNPGPEETLYITPNRTALTIVIGADSYKRGSLTTVGSTNNFQLPENITTIKIAVDDFNVAENYIGVQSNRLVEIVHWGDEIGNGFIASDCPNLIKVPETLPHSITYLQSMFQQCTKFNQDISMWDVSRVKNIIQMFFYAPAFNQNLSSWSFNSAVKNSFYDAGAGAWQSGNKPKFI